MNTTTRAAHDNWTIAYRSHSNANRFVRVSGLELSWHEAREAAQRFISLFPAADVYYVPTLAAERADTNEYTQEDHGTVMNAAGKRIRMVEGNLPHLTELSAILPSPVASIVAGSTVYRSGSSSGLVVAVLDSSAVVSWSAGGRTQTVPLAELSTEPSLISTNANTGQRIYVGPAIHDGSPADHVRAALQAAQDHPVPAVRDYLTHALTEQLERFPVYSVEISTANGTRTVCEFNGTSEPDVIGEAQAQLTRAAHTGARVIGAHPARTR